MVRKPCPSFEKIWALQANAVNVRAQLKSCSMPLKITIKIIHFFMRWHPDFLG
jgi:hypothetical protein